MPACSDAELLTIALVRHLLGRRSQAGLLAEVARDWAHLFPRLPHQSEANRRIRWLWGASEQLRPCWRPGCPKMTVSRSTPPRCRSSTPPGSAAGPVDWPGDRPGARSGRDAAHAEWFCGFRLAIKADLGSRVIRAWSIVPAAVNDREVALDLLETGPAPCDLLADKGFNGKAFAGRQRMPGILQKVIAEWRNRIETSFGEISDRIELARYGAHTFWVCWPRTAATIAAHALLLVRLT